MTSDLDEAIDILRNWKGIMPGALVERINRLLARHPEPPKLLPCPFCGNANSPKIYRGQPRERSFWIHCDQCAAEAAPFSSKDAAIAAWNRRAP